MSFARVEAMRVQGEGSQAPGPFPSIFFHSHPLSPIFLWGFFLHSLSSNFLSFPFSLFFSCTLPFLVSHPYLLSFSSLSFCEEPGSLCPKRKCCIFRLKSTVRSSLILRACWNFVSQLLRLYRFLHVIMSCLMSVDVFCFLITAG